MARYIPESEYLLERMAARSEAAHRGWETRWERDYFAGKDLSPKAQAYIDKAFGPEIGAGGGYEDDFPDYDHYDYYDEDDSPGGH